ncbi:hypothetical protein KDA00_00960 [Candidatus Saccharibacteria bacterium]|nr:hypothetical protein [Candidatus Saccharibacteria bacterium]
MSYAQREHVAYPEFSGLEEGQQLFDIWNDYYTDRVGPAFPDTVMLPIGGVPTEEGEAIFGHHFDVMAQRQREWQFAWRLFSFVRDRLEFDIPIEEGGETVIALPRTDFNEKQNEIAQDGTVKRGLSAFADRSGFDFPEHFEASRDLPRYTRILEDGSVELVQEQDATLAVREAGIATSGIVVAVRRLYGPTHQQFERDLRAVEMSLVPHSTLSEEHEEHPVLMDTYRDRADDKLDLSDDAIIERLNGQRPRTYDWGTVV